MVLGLTGTAFSVIQEADGNAHEAWKLLLDKYDVLSQKQNSLTDVTEEWNNSRLSSVKVDPDDWFTYLYRVNAKFKKIKTKYGKDDDQIKPRVLVNLTEEYEAIQTNLRMNPTYSYADYKTHIHMHWLVKLGGKEILEKGNANHLLLRRRTVLRVREKQLCTQMEVMVRLSGNVVSAENQGTRLRIAKRIKRIIKNFKENVTGVEN